MFVSRLDNRAQAMNVARNRVGPGHPQTQVNSANAQNRQAQLNQEEPAAGNKTANNSNAKNKPPASGARTPARFQQMRQFEGGAAAAGEAPSINAPQVKLPRTGIDQIYTAERPRFIETHREFERIAAVNVSLILLYSMSTKMGRE
jgi:hypothetical protein